MSNVEARIDAAEQELSRVRERLDDARTKLHELEKDRLAESRDYQEKVEEERKKWEQKEEQLRRELKRVESKYAAQANTLDLNIKRFQREVTTKENVLEQLRNEQEDERRRGA